MRQRRKRTELDTSDAIDPFTYLEMVDDELDTPETEPKKTPARRNHARGNAPDKKESAGIKPAKKKGMAIFVTGTDTGVGKTIATYVLGALLKSQGKTIGVLKPVQCGGNDADFFKKHLEVKDNLQLINPYSFKESVSPHLAFRKARVQFNKEKVVKALDQFRAQYDITLVEGAGGLMVPLTEKYLVADLIKDLGLEAVIVSRPGLGTINHTLLTIEQLRGRGIPIRGIIFNHSQESAAGVPEKTNPQTVSRIGHAPTLGVIPYISGIADGKPNEEILKLCGKVIDLSKIQKETETKSGDQLKLWDKKYIWHPFTQMKDWESDDPLIITSANGSQLIDSDGKSYIDGVSSLWVNVHGHNHSEINQAIKRQIDQLAHSTLLGLSHPPAIELARKLVDISPRGLTKVFYSDNGSTAVEVAIKMAYQYWQNTGKTKKTQMAHLTNSYHGDTLGSVSVGGMDLFHKVYKNVTFPTVSVDFPDFYRIPKGYTVEKKTKEFLSKMEELFKKQKDQIAALVVEPLVQGAAGILVWPEGVLKQVANLCRKYDVFLIADEVATGFGRTGKMFACDHEKISPDFLCVAKGFTGGYLPLAATLTSERVYKGFVHDYKDQKAFFHGHTYSGNPLGCAAALASLQIFQEEQTFRRLGSKIKYLSEKLPQYHKLSHVGDVRQKGFMIGIELVKDKDSKAAYPWEDRIGVKVCEQAREWGVILRPLGNVIVLMPPLTISQADLKTLLDVTFRSIAKVTGQKIAEQSAAPRRRKRYPPRNRRVVKKKDAS